MVQGTPTGPRCCVPRSAIPLEVRKALPPILRQDVAVRGRSRSRLDSAAAALSARTVPPDRDAVPLGPLVRLRPTAPGGRRSLRKQGYAPVGRGSGDAGGPLVADLQAQGNSELHRVVANGSGRCRRAAPYPPSRPARCRTTIGSPESHKAFGQRERRYQPHPARVLHPRGLRQRHGRTRADWGKDGVGQPGHSASSRRGLRISATSSMP
jgi:hypothetical protein